MSTGQQISAANMACFEAGISLGTIFHQFVGTPVTEDTAPALEAAIEETIPHQIGVTGVDADIAVEELNPKGFAFLSGDMLTISLTTVVDDVEVLAIMSMEDGYPLMRVDTIDGE